VSTSCQRAGEICGHNLLISFVESSHFASR
jgi:hypothetical protein